MEELSLNCTVIDIDYDSFKYLINLKYLNISCFNVNHLNDLIKALNKYNQNINDLRIFILNDYYKDNKEINLEINLELKNLKNFEIYYDYNFTYHFNNYKINTFNFDKCPKIESITIPYYFECNNQEVLNNIKIINLTLFDTSNIEFLKKILSCENLNDLTIACIIPFKNLELLDYLFDHIGKISCSHRKNKKIKMLFNL